ncbi:MAG TPA: hypothetical protein VFS16_09610 [Acidimicrobiia bacterium]|nr:hypothetical protein [Acidimicrobiia bacterium]
MASSPAGVVIGPRPTLDERHAVLIAALGVLAVATLTAVTMIIEPGSGTGPSRPSPVSAQQPVTAPPPPPKLWLGPDRPQF